jgi:long-chain fatty acid transport protein
MSKYRAFRRAAIAAVIAGPLTAAMATNGYFSHGYGMKAKGMGGASIAVVENGFAGANNPATAAFAGNHMELGLDLFMPERSMTRTGGMVADVKSDSNLFYVPEFDYNKAVSDKMGVGVTVYGNGGLDTDYGTNMLNGSGRLGIDISQLIVAPTMGYKLNEVHSVGISPLLVYQTMKAFGLQGFAGISNDSTSLTDNGTDTSSGVGVRLGYLAKFSDRVSFGASYTPKIAMSKFSKYKGLFAEGGGFDIPENYALGVSLKATPAVTVALDYERINYGGVKSVSNPMTNVPNLGLAEGKGFGWSSIDVWKLGVQWEASPKLTMRAGYNVGGNPVQSRDITFNILAPGVVTTHYTLGGTYAMSNKSDVTVAYMYAPSNSVTGTSFYGAPMVETIKMSQQSLGFQYGWHW